MEPATEKPKYIATELTELEHALLMRILSEVKTQHQARLNQLEVAEIKFVGEDISDEDRKEVEAHHKEILEGMNNGVKLISSLINKLR